MLNGFIKKKKKLREKSVYCLFIKIINIIIGFFLFRTSVSNKTCLYLFKNNTQKTLYKY